MKVSVVIPAFNAAATVGKAVRSAWEQTHPPVEVIVASDGSTDDTATLARAAGATVLKLPKGNGNVARNAGVSASTGELLAFLDADDWFLPGKLEAHVHVHGTGDWSFVVDPATTVDPGGKPGRLCGPALGAPLGLAGFTSRTHWYGGSSFTVRRDWLDAIGGWREELRRQQDVDLWLRLAHHHGPAFVMAESHTFYLQTPGSVSRAPTQIREGLETLLAGLPFLEPRDRRRLVTHIISTAVDNTPFPASVPLLAWTWRSAGDPRWAKALVRSVLRRFAR